MQDPAALLTLASTAVAGVGITSAAALRGWQGWLELRRFEVESGRKASEPPSSMARIEVADLKERIRKLEAIATGIDI
jgi:hypothetical protein